MYIRGLIPRNFVELAESVAIASTVALFLELPKLKDAFVNNMIDVFFLFFGSTAITFSPSIEATILNSPYYNLEVY